MSTQIIITLAHLLDQTSPNYDTSKNSLLDTTANLAMTTSTSSPQNEVHAVLTGSPRPTFAETNAWLLEHGEITQPHGHRKRSNTSDSVQSDMSHDLEEYVKESQLMANANMNDLGGSPTRIGGSVLSHYRSRKGNSEGDVGGGSSGNHSENNHATTNTGPLVGHAVVNAIAQTKGVGLHCSRAKLLQGTIDRPLWDQRRWTDGECLFSDLVDRCGLESFAYAASHDGDVADDAAGKIGQRNSNLSAHLITVPPQVLISQTGMDEETVNEIARGIIRFMKRKSSPVASTVYLIVPEEEWERREIIAGQLKEAWVNLEQYNDMIGQIKLLDGVQFEFVDVCSC